ncbi:MAG: MFS transporter [Flaviflexus sp.]|uniref:MFS transporter n=2 Tax=Flaviflexus sp. TaxID=1969482 RepID=UPI003F928364
MTLLAKGTSTEAKLKGGDMVDQGGLRRGDPDYRRAVIALFAMGLASFNAIYCTQALMPALSDYFGATPAMSAWTVSAATGMLALAILPASILSERFGRGRVMVISSLLAVTVGALLPFAPTIEWLIVGRALQGLAVAGVPATAMAYLADEINGIDLPRAMGQYIAGTSLGGLLSRLIPAGVLEFESWRWGLGINMIFAGSCAILTVLLMPKQKRFTPKKLTIKSEIKAVWRHLTNPTMLGLFAIAFLLMGAFVSLYDYLGYRLADDFGFSPGLAGSVFILYLVGTFTSGWAGGAAVKAGRAKILMLGITSCLIALPLITINSPVTTIMGTAIFTGGFFIAHSIASGWVGALARKDRAEATGMYLTAYYLGSSIVGVVSGLVFHDWGWTAMIIFLAVSVIAAALTGIYVARNAGRQYSKQ